jgi:hypothetical protein
MTPYCVPLLHFAQQTPRWNAALHNNKLLIITENYKDYDCRVGRDSSVGIAIRYELEGPGERIPAMARFAAPVQTGTGIHPVSCVTGARSFPGVKRLGRRVDHPPPKLKKEHSYTFAPPPPGQHRPS